MFRVPYVYGILVRAAKMAEPIEVQLGRHTRVFGRESHWRHLTSVTERSVHGGDATLCQVTLTTWF